MSLHIFYVYLCQLLINYKPTTNLMETTNNTLTSALSVPSKIIDQVFNLLKDKRKIIRSHEHEITIEGNFTILIVLDANISNSNADWHPLFVSIKDNELEHDDMSFPYVKDNIDCINAMASYLAMQVEYITGE